MSVCSTENFRHVLIRISKRIGSDTLQSLKYLCLDIVIPAADMEKVNRPLDLIKALEGYGKISAENSDYLYTLLERVEETRLAKMLLPFCSFSTGEMYVELSSRSSGTGSELPQHLRVIEEFDVPEAKPWYYRQLLNQIFSSLTRENVHNLCLLFKEEGWAGVDNHTNIDGLMFINFLEKKKLISPPNNLEYLRVQLEAIGRTDLQNLIDEYLNRQLTLPLGTPASVGGHYQQHEHQPRMHSLYHSPGKLCGYSKNVLHNLVCIMSYYNILALWL